MTASVNSVVADAVSSLIATSVLPEPAISLSYDWNFRYGGGNNHHVAQNSADQQLRPRYSGRALDSVGAAEHGTVSLDADGEIFYTPATDFVGVDSFKYAYSNYTGSTTEATAYVNVTESVYAIPDWMRVLPGSGATSLDILDNDYVLSKKNNNSYSDNYYTLPENNLVITNISTVANGTVMIDGEGVSYTPNAGFEGIDEFTYSVRDSYGNESTATAKVHVTADANNGRHSNAEHFFISALSAQVKENQERFGAPRDGYGFSYDYYGGLGGVQFASVIPQIATESTSLQLASADVSARSVTTRQVEGVDEGDILKRTEDVLYIATGNELKIVDVSDATNPSLVTTVSFDDSIVDLYVFENRLTVITEVAHKYDSAQWTGPNSNLDPAFGVHVMNIADPANTELVYSTDVDGDYRDSRFIDGTLYLVAAHGSWHGLDDVDTAEENSQFYESISDYVGRVSLDGAMQTSYTVVDANGTNSEQLFDWSDVPTTFSASSNLVAVITFDTLLDSGQPTDTDVTEYDWGTTEIYASKDSIYLFTPTRIETGNEYSHWGRSTHTNGTRIQKFDILDNNTGVELVATGTVEGTLPDQFAADEYEGYFRIATDSWGSEVNLFVMAQQGDALNIVGSIEDIAPGERIYSTRFDGDRGFVTTYRKVDPLFVIDLSDPTTPTIEGELKIPSYSNYMQVINENYVLGIGRDANDGLYDGLQVSLFNVSDPEDPQLVAKYEFAGGRDTWSPVADAWNLLDHHAVTFVAETGVLALPTYTSSKWGGGGTTGTDEAISVLKIDIENETVDLVGAMEFDERAHRSLFVDGYLYGISSETVQVVDAATPDAAIASLDLDATPPTAILNLPMAAKSTFAGTGPGDDSAAQPNATLPDINGDGDTTPIDAVMIANMANKHGFGAVSDVIDARYDVNNDQKFTPVDFLMVVNQLNTQAIEVEQSSFVQPPFARSASAATVEYVFDDGTADDDDDDVRESRIDAVFSELADDGSSI